MGLNNLVRSKGYQNFMSKLYGIGASIVILGALFKIQHFPGAGWMLGIGMGIEAIIFAFSAFEPLHVEYDWSLVYPELAGMEGQNSRDNKKKIGGSVTQQLDGMLSEAKIGPDLIESLGKGLRNLSETTTQLGEVTSASVATDEYIKGVKNASVSVQDLSASYKKTSDALQQDLSFSEAYLNNVQSAAGAVGKLATIYEDTAKSLSTEGGSYTEQLKKMSNSLSSINTLYEMQLQNSNSQLDAAKQMQNGITEMLAKFSEAADNTTKYKEQVDALTQKVSALNNIYGNMLSAMKNNA